LLNVLSRSLKVKLTYFWSKSTSKL